MGYDNLNVTYGKGNTKTGPIWFNPATPTADLTLAFAPEQGVEGWVRLGDIETEGITSTQEADSADKFVWGAKKVGTVYSNFKDTVTGTLVSLVDPDVLKVLFGSENVTISNGTIKTEVKNRQPEKGQFVFMALTDDGRDQWVVVPEGQLDVNLERTWGDEDYVAAEITIGCLEDDNSRTHYELVEALDNQNDDPVTPED